MNSSLKRPALLINLVLVAGIGFFGFNCYELLPTWQSKPSAETLSKLKSNKQALETQIAALTEKDRKPAPSKTDAVLILDKAAAAFKPVGGDTFKASPITEKSVTVDSSSVTVKVITVSGSFDNYSSFKQAISTVVFPVVVKSLSLDGSDFELTLETAGV